MSESSNGQPATNNPGATIGADVETIRQLVRLMHRFDLTAIDLTEGQTQIRLRRRNQTPMGVGVAPLATPVPMMMAAAPIAPIPGAASPVQASPPEPPKPKGLIIESPMVGTFFVSSSPDSPPHVSVGASVRENTTVCVIEAMKVFTDIPAGVSGVVTEVLAKNGQAVEFGQPLFRVEPN